MTYLFDTNIFIRSKNDMPMEIWPTFWTKVAGLIESGKIFSVVNVKAEIERGKDELTDWVKENAPKSFFIDVDQDVINKYQEAQQWATQKDFTDGAKRDFAMVADAYLVATAAAKGMSLVTYETPDPNCKRRVKIPDACDALGVRYCDLNTAFRELHVTI
jgi:predicted nucleic acid-binding protein